MNSFKKALATILVLVMCTSLVACGKKEEKFSGLGASGKDFRNSNIGDSMATVKIAEKDLSFTDFGPSEMSQVPEMAGMSLQYAEQNNMHVLMCKDADMTGHKAELVYAFVRDQLAMCITGYTNLEDTKKYYDEMVAYYDGKYGEPAKTDAQSRMYTQGSVSIVVSYDGDKNLGVSLINIDMLK